MKDSNVIPLYGRGTDVISENTPKGVGIPPRPQANRGNIHEDDHYTCKAQLEMMVKEHERMTKYVKFELSEMEHGANQRATDLQALHKISMMNSALVSENHRLQSEVYQVMRLYHNS